MVQSINATIPLEEARATLATAYDLKFTKAVAKVTSHIRFTLKDRISDEEWAIAAPLIVHINRVKKEKSAAILADFHQTPTIYSGVADRVGDDMTLLLEAGRLRQPTLVIAGVLTLAETIKLANPKRRVLIPDSRATCPLATSITREDVEAIRSQYPGAKVLAHVNSPLGVKAVADATFTAANALAVVEATEGDRVIMVPDQFLAQYVARQTSKKIVTWAGTSEAFGGFTADSVAALRETHPEAKILAHPQNPPAAAAAADFTGTTAAMADWLKTERPALAAVLGEDAVADNLAATSPDTAFVRANGAEPQRRCISLESVLWSLHTMTEEISISPDLTKPAQSAVQRMLEVSKAG
jgi:quinolinate synthase